MSGFLGCLFVLRTATLGVFFLFELLGYVFMFGYVSNDTTFPDVLSKQDETRYLEMHMNGDLHARDMLIVRNLRLVAHVAKRFNSSHKGYESDLISIGSIGLIKGIDTYKTDKDVKLATYVSKCISNEILMYLRQNKKNEGTISIEEIIGTDSEGNERLLSDILPDDVNIEEDVIQSVTIAIMVEMLGDTLNEKEQKIIKARYGIIDKNDEDLKDGKEYTQREIAEKMNISRSYVSRIEKKVLKKMNDELLKET